MASCRGVLKEMLRRYLGGSDNQTGRNEMSIKTIRRSEFDQLAPYNPALEGWMVEQVEWFSNRPGTMLGAIARSEGVAGWNYAVLKRGKQRGFYVRKVMNNFFNLKATRVDLLLSMAATRRSGVPIHTRSIRPGTDKAFIIPAAGIMAELLSTVW
jgi:hypothetical protein